MSQPKIPIEGMPPRMRATVNNLPYLSVIEHQQLLDQAVQAARAEAYAKGKRDAYKQANSYTDRCYAGLIAAEAEAEEMLEFALTGKSEVSGG